MHVIQGLGFFVLFFFLSAAKWASKGRKNIPTFLSKTLAISRTPLPNWKRKQEKFFCIYVLSSSPGKILRWGWSYIPHFSHLRLPLCREVTGLILHGYSTRPPRRQTAGVSGRGCLVGQVQDAHQQHAHESELSGAAVALQDRCVCPAAQRWQLQGKRKGNLLFSM